MIITAVRLNVIDLECNDGFSLSLARDTEWMTGQECVPSQAPTPTIVDAWEADVVPALVLADRLFVGGTPPTRDKH